jgi:uncharacterized membrane protein YqhA
MTPDTKNPQNHDAQSEQKPEPCPGETTASRRAEAARKVTGWTRFIATVPAVGLFLGAIALAVATLVETVISIGEFYAGGVKLTGLAVEFVEYADIFLLAVVLYIMALGLFTLFVSDKIPLPLWLEFHDFDDLKERLVSVICVMLGVSFLGVVLEGATGIDLLWLGLATAVVIGALTLFVKHVIKGEE